MAVPVRVKQPKVKRKFTDATKMNLSNTLSQNLIPVVDSIRDLHTQFGQRPYRVSIVRVAWSEGHRGRGVPTVKAMLHILPTPLVQDLSTMTEILTPIGLNDTGTIVVSQISGRFTDNQLRFLEDDGQEPGPAEEVFYEIEYPQPGRLSETNEKRRFFIRGTPFYNASQFHWTLRLEKTNEDRTRTGDPR